jgi:mono/diheme cytochrome c family protein
MWNHPALPNNAQPPQLEGRDMNDIMAYARRGPSIGLDWLLVEADADRGWKLYHDKACVTCHSLKGEAGRVGPDLGPGRELPPTIVQLAGSMWNHSAAMSQAMAAKGVQRPKFTDREMADVIAFLYSIRAAEPGGSPTLGEVVFEARGCSSCHGSHAEGTPSAPGLRGKNNRYSSISLGTVLWHHGPEMNQRVKEKGVKWPDLSEGDVGDLIAFLNSAQAGSL